MNVSSWHCLHKFRISTNSLHKIISQFEPNNNKHATYLQVTSTYASKLLEYSEEHRWDQTILGSFHIPLSNKSKLYVQISQDFTVFQIEMLSSTWSTLFFDPKSFFSHEIA